MSFGVHCGISGCTAKHKPTLFGAEGDCIISPAQTPAQRVAKLRADRDALGLRRLELYAHRDDWPAIKALAERLQRKRAKAPK